MDLIICLSISLIASIIKIIRYGSSEVLLNDKEISSVELSNETSGYEVGNNLGLKREQGAYTRFLKQFGLI